MAQKVTILVLKVDLQCPGCYKKIRKVLCKFPQVRDQIYDEKKNTVTIRVCCSAEKIRDKISYKGGKSIQGIEIIAPSKPKEAEKPKDVNKPKEAEIPKTPEKPKDSEKSKEADKPKGNDEKGEKPAAEKPKEAAKADPPKDQIVEVQPMPVAGVPTAAAYTYYGLCYEGNSMGGPYYQGYGRPITQCVPQPQYHENYGYGYGYDRNAVVNRYDYFSEENPSACSIM